MIIYFIFLFEQVFFEIIPRIISDCIIAISLEILISVILKPFIFRSLDDQRSTNISGSQLKRVSRRN